MKLLARLLMFTFTLGYYIRSARLFISRWREKVLLWAIDYSGEIHKKDGLPQTSTKQNNKSPASNRVLKRAPAPRKRRSARKQRELSVR